MNEFERLGKEILRHKYLYYVLSEPEISDYDYDMLEVRYTRMAKRLAEEPEIHIIADWGELDWMTNGAVVGFPEDHPWSEEIIKKVLDNRTKV